MLPRCVAVRVSLSRASLCLLACLLAFTVFSCDRSDSGGGGSNSTGGAGGGGNSVIGVSFDTLQTEYWVASRDAIEAGIKKRGGEMLLAVANNDSNRQFEQVNNFIAKGVDGIVIAPKDAQSVVPIIKAANRARTSRSSSTTGRPAKAPGSV